MREVFKPRPYQAEAIAWALDKPRCGLFLDMSLGKTVCVLTAIEQLIYERYEVSRVLVVAPPRVAAHTWPAEAAKWAHLAHLRVVSVNGTPKQRTEALERKADVYCISRDSVTWLVDNGLFDFDMLVIDELTSFKSSQAKRFKRLRTVAKGCKRVIGLTGTPSPNGLMDLWAEMYLIDGGKRLGKTITAYRNEYFTVGAHKGAIVYSYVPKRRAQDFILGAISDVCITMRKEDYIQLPEKIFVDVPVTLDARAAKLYRDVERDSLAEIGGDGVIAATTAAAVSNKLQQIADGVAYDDAGGAHDVHARKLDALAEIAEAANGSPVLVLYAFKASKDAILQRFDGARCLETTKDIDAWNAGDIPMAVAHPASVGHGLNLQFGGHIVVWFGLTWSLELYLQANDRLHRPGQEMPVSIYHLIAEGTIDEGIRDALKRKDGGQRAVIDYLKARL